MVIAGTLLRALDGIPLLPLLPGHNYAFFDLGVYRQAGRAVLQGRNIYMAHFDGGLSFTYPPLAALMFTGLALLPQPIDEWIMVAVNVVLVGALGYLSVCLRGGPRPRWNSPAVWAASALALCAEPVITTIGYGQIDLLIATLVLADVACEGDGRWRGAGVGLAAALKLTPLVFIPYLLLVKRGRMAWQALGWFVLWAGVVFVIEPSDASSYWTRALFDTSRVTGAADGRGPDDQSLRGTLMRIASGAAHVQQVWLVLALLIGAIALVLAGRAGRGGNRVLGFELTALAGLLISPVSWTHHWTIALPGLLVLAVSPRPGRGRTIAAAAASAVVASPLIWLAAGHYQPARGQGVDELVLGNAYVWAGLGTILAAAVWAHRRGIARVVEGQSRGSSAGEPEWPWHRGGSGAAFPGQATEDVP